MSNTKKIAATLKMTLSADSGYESELECRVNSDQWGAIQGIAEGLIDPDMAAFASEMASSLQEAIKMVCADFAYLRDKERSAALHKLKDWNRVLGFATGEIQPAPWEEGHG